MSIMLMIALQPRDCRYQMLRLATQVFSYGLSSNSQAGKPDLLSELSEGLHPFELLMIRSEPMIDRGHRFLCI